MGILVIENKTHHAFDDDDSFDEFETSCRPFSLGDAGVREVHDAIGSVMSPSSHSSPSMLVVVMMMMRTTMMMRMRVTMKRTKSADDEEEVKWVRIT